MLDRLPPQAAEVEQQVLGACLISRGAIGRAAAILRSEDAWYHRPHALIWAAILHLEAQDAPADCVTVGQELIRRGQFAAAGGAVYLTELATGIASPANVEHHARIVQACYLLRQVIEIGSGMATAAYEVGAEAVEIVTRASERLYALLDAGRRGGFAPVEAVLSEAVEAVSRAHASPGSLTGVATGLTALDEMTGGWQASDLVILAARPSAGKTALSLGAGVHAALRAGVGVAVFSLEMANLQVGQRLLSMGGAVNLHRLRTGRMDAEEWHRVTAGAQEMARAPIWVDDSPGLTVLEMRTRARQLKQRQGIGLVIVDYLQLGASPERNSNREQEVSRISRGLKALAKELQVPVLALSQLSRAPETRSDHRPQLSDLRESGSIEMEADVVVFLFRPSMYDKSKGNEVELLIRKHRNGPTGDVHCVFDPATATFRDRTPEYRGEARRWGDQ